MVTGRAFGAGCSALAAAMAGLVGQEALAAGFALKEQSAAALGNAFAGVSASAEEPSTMFFNPAAVGFQEGVQLQLIGSHVMPQSELENASGTTVTAAAIGGRSTRGDIAEDAVVPAFYATWRVSPQWAVGLGINAPFGLETSYPENWVGRYHAIDSRLRTVNVNPTLAIRPIPELAIGVGLQVQYAEARLTNAIDFGTIGALSAVPGAVPATQDGKAKLKGDDWDWGFTLGVVGDITPSTRIGIAYRSQVDHTLKGDVDFTLDSAGIGAIVSGATGRFVDTDASADLTTPESLSFGFVQQITDTVDLRGEAQLTRWSRFDELRIRFDNPNETDNVTEENWSDSWFFALGSTWRPIDGLALRAGVAYDQEPIKEKFRTPRIPGNDRYWLAFGASWMPAPWLALDAGYTHIFVRDSQIRLDAADPGNTFRGNLDAEYDNSIDIVTIGGRLIF